MIDLIDKQIIQHLQNNARQSSEALAKQLDLSASTVRRRINKLIENGTLRIIGYVNPLSFGLPITAVIGFDISHDNIDSSIQQLSEKKEIFWLAAASGRYDVFTLALFHSNEELYNFMRKEVAELEGLRNSKTFICLHLQKEFV